MRLGGPAFEKGDDPQKWVNAHRALGYSAAYVPHGLSDDVLDQLVGVAAKSDLLLAEVGAWSNPIAPDQSERKAAVALCIDRLALAERVGARCCVNIAGSRGFKWDGPHTSNFSDETFDMIVQTVRQIIDAVHPTRTVYALETMPWIFPDSPDSYIRLIHAIDRKAFGVHLDPVNMINNPCRAYDTGKFIAECFEKLGKWVVSCHAKDIRLSDQLTVHLDECVPGTGILNYHQFLTLAQRCDAQMPIMLEHLSSAEEYRMAATYVRTVASALNIQLIH